MSDAKRPKASNRPMSIDLDTEGEQFLATAESDNVCVAVYADSGTTDSELHELLGDLQHDLPEQGQRVGVVKAEEGSTDSEPTDNTEAER